MASSSQNKEQIFDAIRGKWVADTPEERIRQTLLDSMTTHLGFPRELIVIEKDLKELPHLSECSFSLPARRADVLCFAKKIHPHHPLYPLLLIECKEKSSLDEAMHQVLGYNYYVKAYFIAVVNESECRTGYFDAGAQEHRFLSFLPSYSQLIALIKNAKK